LLLIFYLALDKSDIPLVIDQPEENLDNQSVFTLLAQFIKKAKEKRQVIIVTHNPNLAVVCDADQFIHVRIEKHNKNKVIINSGALENPEINKAVVDILEGTYEAFDTRDNKYKVIPRPPEVI
jgi:predicted ATPase